MDPAVPGDVDEADQRAALPSTDPAEAVALKSGSPVRLCDWGAEAIGVQCVEGSVVDVASPLVSDRHAPIVRSNRCRCAARSLDAATPFKGSLSMEFLCYHRDRPDSLPLRDELLEAHWSYMDQYAKEMIARGPTFADDGDAPTGSVHIVDLPDPAAARAFAFDEPNYQAGVYRDVLLRRWRNSLGRTMWDFPGGRTGGNRYLVLGLGSGQPVDLAVPPGRDELIAYGPLLSDDGTAWLGTAALLRAPDPDTARAVLTPGRYADIEVHDWEFGGRS